MQRMRSGPAPAGTDASPVTAPGTPTKKPQTYAYYTRTHPEHKPRVTSGFWRGLRFALAFDLFLVAFVVAAAYLVGWIAVHVPTAVVILGGLVLVGLVVVRGAAAS